jgi:hypothetical protein
MSDDKVVSLAAPTRAPIARRISAAAPPACGLFKGAWAFEVERGDQVWECNCGGQLFRIAKHCGPYCANCGAEATGWFD